jgi:hypothetical protein
VLRQHVSGAVALLTVAADRRLTNAFSKKLTNLKTACALHFAFYNFPWIHKTNEQGTIR